jgi:hypothetical protein
MTLRDLLKEMLERSERKHGKDALVTRSLREQLRLADEAPKSAAQQFLVGSVGKHPELEKEEEERPPKGD